MKNKMKVVFGHYKDEDAWQILALSSLKGSAKQHILKDMNLKNLAKYYDELWECDREEIIKLKEDKK